ncbi:4137_t:CDS:2, partial [Cetraspora pellucida]
TSIEGKWTANSKNITQSWLKEVLKPQQTLIKNINNLLTNYIEALGNIKLRAGLEIAMEISQQGNGYLQESKLDNTFLRNALRSQLSAPLRNIPDTFTMDIEAGYQIGKAEYLFKRIDEKIC